MARVHAVTEWAGDCLIVPPGHPNAGRPLVLPRYFDRWLRSATRPRVRQALLSVARRNAKSTGLAVFLLYHLIGPGARDGWRALIGGPDSDRTVETMDHVLQIGAANGYGRPDGSTPRGVDVRLWKRTQPDRPGTVHAVSGARVTFLPGSKRAAHGAGADLAVCEEVGLCEERHRPMVDGLRASVVDRGGRLWFVGTRGFGSPFVSDLLAKQDDPGVHVRIYSAPAKCALDDPKALRAANPGIGSVLSMRNLRADARLAAYVPAEANAWRAWNLNQEVDPTNRDMVIDPDVWESRCVVERDALPAPSGRVAVGLDIGAGSTMTAAAFYWPATGRAEVCGAVAAEPDLSKRGRMDGVGDRYALAHKRRELLTIGGGVMPLHVFLSVAVAPLAGRHPLTIAADANRKQDLESAIREAKLRHWRIKWRNADKQAADLAEFQRRADRGAVRCVENLLLERSIIDSEVLTTPKGGRIVQSRKTARPHPIAALVRAVGAGAEAARRRRPGRVVRIDVA